MLKTWLGHCQILLPPDYDPAPVLFMMVSVIPNFNLLLEKTGMPPLMTP